MYKQMGPTFSGFHFDKGRPEIVLLMQQLGADIRQRRAALNLTIRDLASIADVSLAYIHRIEQGVIHRPEFFPLLSVVRAVGIPVHGLVDQALLVMDLRKVEPSPSTAPSPDEPSFGL